MPPFTVARRSSRPPLPIVPERRLLTILPWTVSGKSAVMSPLTVSALTSTLAEAGSSTLMLPFSACAERSCRSAS